MEFLRKLLEVGDETIMEDSDAFLLVENRVCLNVSHRILTTGIP